MMKKIVGALAASAMLLVCSAGAATAQAEDWSDGGAESRSDDKTGFSMAGNFGFGANHDGGTSSWASSSPSR